MAVSDASAHALREVHEQGNEPEHAFVTLTWAQSVDGSMAFERGRPLLLSGKESMALTHSLRAQHQGILVGVSTVLADDPSLTVRLVQGDNPRPIVLDSQLRCPLDRKILQSGRAPIIFCASSGGDEGKAPRWLKWTRIRTATSTLRLRCRCCRR